MTWYVLFSGSMIEAYVSDECIDLVEWVLFICDGFVSFLFILVAIGNT